MQHRRVIRCIWRELMRACLSSRFRASVLPCRIPFLFGAVLLSFYLSLAGLAGELPDFEQWRSACARLPANRTLRGATPPRHLLPLQTFPEFDAAVSAFISHCTTGTLAQATNWLGVSPAPLGFFDTNRAYFDKTSSRPPVSFKPFAAKIAVPAGSEIYFHADLHGDVHSLLADLNWLNAQGYLHGFSIAHPSFYMVFLGDYTDRGSYGVEVLYTLFRLKAANPDRVFLARGNHEELSLQSRYGFLQEARAKYGSAFDARKLIRAYDFLPVVIYLGTGENYVQCNHGGMEPGYDPRALLDTEGANNFQLLGALHQLRFYKAHPDWLGTADKESRELAERALRDFVPEDPISPVTLGFMWNDFTILESDPQFSIAPGRAFVYGNRATAYLLNFASTPKRKLRAVIRGHQQAASLTPIMRRIVASRGLFRHWQENDSPALLNVPVRNLAQQLDTGAERAIPANSVWTFNVSPDSIYGEACDYSFDTFGILQTAERFEEWRMRIVNIPVHP